MTRSRKPGFGRVFVCPRFDEPATSIRYTSGMDTLPYDAQHLRHLAGEIITNVRELAHAGWTPATSSNF